MATIVILSPLPRSSDGVATHSSRIAEAWDAAGHTVIWVETGARLAGRKGSRKVSLRNAGAIGAIADPRLARRIAALEPDLVFIQFALATLRTSVFAVMLTAAALKRRGVKVVAGCHEGSRETMILGPPVRWLYRALERCCTRLVAFSSGEAQAMLEQGLATRVDELRHGAKPITVSDADIDTVRRRYGIELPLVLTVGFIHPDKGTDLLVEAAPLINERMGGNVEFLIAGEPRARVGVFKAFARADERFGADLAGRVGELSSTLRIRLAGFVPDDDLPALLSAASVFVLPYRTGTQSGIAAWALAAGLPFVVADLPGPRSQLGSAARLFTPGDHFALADATTAVLADDLLRSRLAETARQIAAEQSYERVAAALLAIASSADK